MLQVCCPYGMSEHAGQFSRQCICIVISKKRMKMSCDYKTDLCIHTDTNGVSIKLYLLSQHLYGYITRNNLKGIIINHYSLKSRLIFSRYLPRLKIVLVYTQEVISSIDEKETI